MPFVRVAVAFVVVVVDDQLWGGMQTEGCRDAVVKVGHVKYMCIR
jgi:hypothetical protein